MAGKRFRFVPLLLIALVLAAAGVVLQQPGRTAAAPAGAAQNLHVTTQTCAANGTVTASFGWTPSGIGQQWFDISVSNFTAGWWPSGPYSASKSSVQVTNLQPNVTYQIRVTTYNGSGYLVSDTLAFLPTACGSSATFTPPTNFLATVAGNSTTFHWNRGSDNAWFCVDTAFSQSDLVNVKGSWANWGCGTTNTTLTVQNLQCGTLHYARVYAAGASGDGYSNIDSFTTGPCAFSPPDDLHTSVLGPNTVRFSWDRGVNNAWFCIDTAYSISDLINLTGSWGNHGCGTTGESFTSNALVCGKEHVWRVYAYGPNGGGYSQVRSFTSDDCPFSPPDNLQAEAQGPDSVLFDWDPGINNVWFCVDTAESIDDLVDFDGTWEFHGCGTTASELLVEELPCDTKIYWRVFAWGPKGSGHSDVSDVMTDACE